MQAKYSNQRVGTRYVMGNFGDALPLPDSALFPEGASSAAGVFSLYITGAGELAQGKSGLDEQRQANVVNNLSVTRADDQLEFGEWRINPLSRIRRAALDPVGAEAKVLKPEKRRNSILASLKPAKSRMVGHPEVEPVSDNGCETALASP